MWADKESGTCPSGTDEPHGKASFNAALRCKIVDGQAAHNLADALPADIRERYCVKIQIFLKVFSLSVICATLAHNKGRHQYH